MPPSHAADLHRGADRVSAIANYKPLGGSIACVPFAFGNAVPEEGFQQIQNRMALDCCKWDAQIGDVSTLFRQSLLMDQETWQELVQVTEALASELMSAEHELLERPDLQKLSGLPGPLRSVFA